MLFRSQVDELMRQELANWKLAVDKDKGGKAKGNAKVMNLKTDAFFISNPK